MKALFASRVLTIFSGQAIAGEATKCTLEFTCANTYPCQTTKTGSGVDFQFEKLHDDQLHIDLGNGRLPLLKVFQVSEDLKTAHGWDEDRSASYAFSVFSDGIVAYTTHAFTGKGISLTGLG